MGFSIAKAVASYLSIALLATQGHVVQSRILEPLNDAPTNCEASDFELPATVVGAWNKAGLPDFISLEIFATFVALKDGWVPGFASTETPIVARLTHLVDTMHWNCAAMYSSTWLDALTKEDPLLRSPASFEDITFHSSTPRLLCMVHAWAAVVKEWHPESFPSLSGVLGAFEYQDVSFAYNDEVDSAFDEDTGEPDIDRLVDIAASNCYKPKIMGAIVARQMTEYGRRDGYNMYGDLDRNGEICTANCRRYTDPTNFKPDEVRAARQSKFSWKPMLEDDGRGYFTRQAHVTPHIGFTAKRAVLSDEDFNSRISEEPNYNYQKQALKVAERLKETATSDEKKVMIEFYDNKIGVFFAVVGAVLSYGLSFEQLLNYTWGFTAAEYDSILVAWKEKVRHNLLRPTTFIQENLADIDLETYAGPNQGVKTVKGKDFESWVRVMPHSEFVSGSGCICQTIKDFTEDWMELTVGKLAGPNVFVSGTSVAVPLATDDTGRDAPFIKGSSRTEPGVTPAEDMTMVAGTLKELRNQCGESRLDGGMHFQKSVKASYDLCRGIGNEGAKYSIDLLGEGGWEDSIVPSR